MKRCICLVLSLLLLFTGCLPGREVAHVYLRDRGSTVHHGHTPFSSMVLVYLDPQDLLDRSQKLLEKAASSEDATELEKEFANLARKYGELVSAASLAYVRHCQDVTDRDRAMEYGTLNGSLYPIQTVLLKTEKLLMDRFGFHRDRGAAYVEMLDRVAGQDTPLLQSLHRQEDDLCRQYEQLDATYRLDFQGRSWSMEELMADETLSMSSFLEALEAFARGRNQAAGSLFLQLMAIRNQMAKAMGYASYADSQYAAYGRDRMPADSLAAAQIIKQVFVPLYARWRERCENEMKYLGGASFPEDSFLAAMEAAAEKVVHGGKEAWRYMLAYGLYDGTPSKKKLRGSFTTYFSAYGCPFILTQWQGDASSVFTVIHEFGHFLSYYLNPVGTYYEVTDLDLAELDAQGFELFMTEEYDAIFGRYATAARLCFFMNALYAILSGFMEDEFQQSAYAMEAPTVEKLNQLYGRLSKEYGFDKLFGYGGMEWTDISHTFRFPFYYVSYGIGMLGAMSMARQGRRIYRRLLHRSGTEPFAKIIGVDVLSEESIRDLAVWVENKVDTWLQA